MSELCLHGLDRVAGGDGLTHDRVAAERVVAERSKPNRAATAPSSVKGDLDRRGRRPLDPHDAVRFPGEIHAGDRRESWRKADVPCLTGSLRCRSLTYMVTGSGDGKPVT